MRQLTICGLLLLGTNKVVNCKKLQNRKKNLRKNSGNINKKLLKYKNTDTSINLN